MHAATRRWLLLLTLPVAACAALPLLRSTPRVSTAPAPAETVPTTEPPPAPPRIEAHEEPAAEPRREVAREPEDELARLEAIELAAAPDDAPTAIHDLAALARASSPRERDDAARTLTRWLREETRRDAADARGNVPNLIEALGVVGGDLAVNTLVDALDDDRHDLALKTLIVQQLGGLGDARAIRAVSRFALVAENTAVRDDFDAELRDEALAAADESGRRLRH